MNVYKDWLGIPEEKLPASGPPDHYELLRLRRFEDDQDRIQGNYKKLNAHVRQYAQGAMMEQSQTLLNQIARAMLTLTDIEAKRDYDESLGREFAEEPDEAGRRPLDRIMIEDGIASRDQIKEAVAFADARGLSLRDAVVQMKLADPEQAARALAKHLNRSFVDLNEVLPEDDTLDGLDRLTVKRHTLIPLFVENDRLVVASVDEPEPDIEEELRFRYGVPLRPVIATPRAIQQAIGKYYAPGMRDTATAVAKTAEPEPETAMKSKGKKGDKKGKDTKDKPAVDEATKKAADPTIRFSQLTPEQQAERKKAGFGIIFAAFGLPNIAQILLQQFTSPNGSMSFVHGLPWFWIPFTIPAAIWVFTKYLK